MENYFLRVRSCRSYEKQCNEFFCDFVVESIMMEIIKDNNNTKIAVKDLMSLEKSKQNLFAISAYSCQK